MRISVSDARSLVFRTMRAVGSSEAEAEVITDHIVDCELRGVFFGGLARALAVAERVRAAPGPTTPIAVVHETPLSARLDGGDQAGYLVAHRATSLAMEKAATHGIGIAGASRTWYTGMFAYYMEKVARADLVGLAFGSASWRVAPHGANEGRFGTNPIAFGFPTEDEPIVLDVGTSSIMFGEVMLRQRLGQPLPEGSAFDADGEPTRDPAVALHGAFTVWGGHKGAGLAICMQLFGLLAGGPLVPPAHSNCSYLVIALRPDLLMPLDEFKARTREYAEAVRSARPIEEGRSARMPFDRSIAERRRRLAEGSIEVSDVVYAALEALVS